MSSCKVTKKWPVVWQVRISLFITLAVFLISGGLGCTAGIEKKEGSEVRQSKEIPTGTPAIRHPNGSNDLRKGLYFPIAAAEEETPPDQESSEAEPEEAPQAEEVLPEPSRAPAASPGVVATNERVSLNFNHADLVEVVHVLAQHLKLNYTIDPNVKGSVTIHSAEPLKKEDLLPIFHQILRMNGAVAIKSGDLHRIVPIKEGKGLVRPATPARGDSYALRVVPVRFFSVGEMKKLLEPFVTPGGEVLVYPRGNFLIIVDLPSNIRRLIEIKDLIDVRVFSGARMEIYQPKVASAEELAEEMTKIMQAYASSVPQAEGFVAQFIAIPRINQLLVINHSESAWTYAKRWLERIDVVAEGPGKRIFVYAVENGKAEDLADVLSEVLGLGTPGRRETRPTLQDLHRATRPTSTTPGFPSPLFGSGSSSTSLSTGSQTSTQGAFAVAPRSQEEPQARADPPPPSRRTPPPSQEQMRIVADPATNSLIIFGTAQEFQNIKNILKDIDIMPRQVLMEVLVAEVSLTDDLEFGVDYAFQRGGIESTVLPTPLERGGAIFGSTGLTSVITSGADFRAIITALMEDSKVKVLSHPSILAVDNQPARIQVGSEQPVATGFTTAEVGTTASSTTIQFRNVGRILTIIPQVNSQGLVHLQVKVEVSERGALITIGQDQFESFDTRDAETTAVVQDGHSLAIGGIITERKSRVRTGIPYLMDVPVFGRFFGVTTDNVERTELVILITPHVIRNREEADRVTEEFTEKLSAVRRELERLRTETPRPPVKEPVPEQETEQESAPQESPPIAPEPQSRKNTQDRPASHGTSNDPASAPAQKIKHDLPSDGNDRIEIPAGGEERESDGDAANDRPVLALASKDTSETETGQARWSVQVWAYPNEKSSRELVQKLRERGYDAYMVKADVEGQTWYRVRVGRLATRAEARRLRKTLAKEEKFTDALIFSRPTSHDILNDPTPAPAQKIKHDLPSDGNDRIEIPAGGEEKESDGEVAKDRPDPALASKDTSETETGQARWSVQVWAYPNEESSRKLVQKLRERGYDAYMVKADVEGQTWHRVRVGLLATRQQAKNLQETLAEKENYDDSFIFSY